MKKVSFGFIFHVLCTIITASLVLRCMILYHQDDDTTQVEYRKFHHGEEFIYPSISICFEISSLLNYTRVGELVLSNPELSRYRGNGTGAKCLQEKNKYHEDCYDIRRQFYAILLEPYYEEITNDLLTDLLSIRIVFTNTGWLVWSNSKGTLQLSKESSINTSRSFADAFLKYFSRGKYHSIPSPKLYPSFKSLDHKCYSLDVPFIKNTQIRYLDLDIRGTMFNHGIRPSKNEFRVTFHYPGQQILSISSQTHWRSKYSVSTSYYKSIHLAYIRILKRRNKTNYPCQGNNYDQFVIEKTTKSVGCKKYLLNSTDKIPFCTSYSDRKAFKGELTYNLNVPPCNTLISAYDWYEDYSSNLNWTDPNMVLRLYYPNEFYMEVNYMKAYSFESLIGNIGGYIGKL